MNFYFYFDSLNVVTARAVISGSTGVVWINKTPADADLDTVFLRWTTSNDSLTPHKNIGLQGAVHFS